MTHDSRVLWTEGMFLRPQHFQQHDRWLEHHVEVRVSALRNHAWGFVEINIDKQLLGLGKLAVKLARGVFADGTPVDVPATDEPPVPLDLDDSVRDQVIYLCMPARRAGASEYERDQVTDGLARYRHARIEVRDTSTGEQIIAPIDVGRPRLRLLRASEPRDDYVVLGVLRVVEVRADKSVVVDESYIPPLLDCAGSDFLGGFMSELQGMLAQRAAALAARVTGSSKGGVSELSDFLMLLVVNRAEPVLEHMRAIRGIHAEDFYRFALALAGESASFTAPSRRPFAMPPYRHDDLQATFKPLIEELRRSLNYVSDSGAIAIKLEERGRGFRLGRINDRSLIGNANFVLAVAASVPQADIARRFPQQVKIGGPHEIKEFVKGLLPGIPVTALGAAPRQIPYHAGSVYFELDPRSTHWAEVRTMGNLVLHIGVGFPDLTLECWAIKR